MRKLALVLLVLFWIILVIFSFGDLTKLILPQKIKIKPSLDISDITQTATGSSVLVTRVIDGDTIELSTGQKVRYIGMNTPETVDPRKPVQCFGKEANAENKKLVEGKTVRLEKDVSETDKYGRLLRYVYVDKPSEKGQGIFVNDYLTRNGFAYVSTFPPDVKFAQQFKNAQDEARINKRGLWNGCPIK